MAVLTLKFWNDLIENINQVRQSPPDDTDCSPLPPIDKYDGKTAWKLKEIKRIQDAVKELCSSISFGEDLTKPWNQSWLDEITQQLGNAWCDCQPDDDDDDDDDTEPCSDESYDTHLQTLIPTVYTEDALCGRPNLPPDQDATAYIHIGNSLLPAGRKGIFAIVRITPEVGPHTYKSHGEDQFSPGLAGTTVGIGAGTITNGVVDSIDETRHGRAAWGVSVFADECNGFVTEAFTDQDHRLASYFTNGEVILRVTCTGKVVPPSP